MRQLAFCFIWNKRRLWLHLLGYRNMTQCFYSSTFDWFQIIFLGGLPCHLVICLRLPFSIFTTFLRNAVVQKASVASQYRTKSLWIIPMLHQCGVTIILWRYGYSDNDSRWSFFVVQGIPPIFFCWTVSESVSPLDTVMIYCIETYENDWVNYGRLCNWVLMW